jgi:PAS domain S-box-containing protein
MPFRLVLIGIGLPLAAVLVGFLKNGADRRFEQLARSEEDIRELHDSLAHALASRERILNQSMDMICTANLAGEFTMVSAACERIFGYSSAEMEGCRFMDFVHPDDEARTEQIAVQIMSGLHTQAFINRYRRKDGAYVHIMWS